MVGRYTVGSLPTELQKIRRLLGGLHVLVAVTVPAYVAARPPMVTSISPSIPIGAGLAAGRVVTRVSSVDAFAS